MLSRIFLEMAPQSATEFSGARSKKIAKATAPPTYIHPTRIMCSLSSSGKQLNEDLMRSACFYLRPSERVQWGINQTQMTRSAQKVASISRMHTMEAGAQKGKFIRLSGPFGPVGRMQPVGDYHSATCRRARESSSQPTGRAKGR